MSSAQNDIKTSKQHKVEGESHTDALFRDISEPTLTAHSSGSEKSASGKWIGIDLGTSNCCCAVWDTQKNKAKIIRMNYDDISIPEEEKYKPGYLIPSTLLFRKDREDPNKIIPNHRVSVGHKCTKELETALKNGRVDPNRASVSSVKRILGITPSMLDSIDDELLDTLPFTYHIVKNTSKEEAIQAVVSPLTLSEIKSEQILVSPKQATAFQLKSIKESAEAKLSEEVKNTIIGVPAHYSKKQRDTVIEAARLAGFSGHVSTLTESTAASLSYGLFVTPSTDEKLILVIDVGGGTADVTIASISNDENGEICFKVRATAGNCRLGGDDVDQAILDFCLEKNQIQNYSDIDKEALVNLRKECCRAKERLCNLILDMELEPKKYSTKDTNEVQVSISFQGQLIILRLHHLQKILESFIARARRLIESIILSPKVSSDINEVILVGGSTNLPPLRTMLRDLFPNIPEFCTSVHPMKAVAQGCAIQCAIRSKVVPKHELRNIMMLDALPHSIGVRVGKDHFVKILNKNESLPARNYQTFQLADLNQKGVTIFCVEDVGDGYPLQPLGEFTFLLHRLSKKVKKSLTNGVRSVDIGMTIDKDGKLIVSIFDWNDPEHLKKKEKYQKKKSATGKEDNSHSRDAPVLLYEEDGSTLELVLLVIACIFLFFFYVGSKILFSDISTHSKII